MKKKLTLEIVDRAAVLNADHLVALEQAAAVRPLDDHWRDKARQILLAAFPAAWVHRGGHHVAFHAFASSPLALPAPSPNHSRARLGECIRRKRALVAAAENALDGARERHAEARALICSGGLWTAQDAIFAEDSYVRDFAERQRWHQKSLDLHTALFRQLHGREAA